MHYSEHPHDHYVEGGLGPGAVFLGDQEKWNWRWLMFGTALNWQADEAIDLFFNDHQRQVMTTPPRDAARYMAMILSSLPPGFYDRVEEAHARYSNPTPAQATKGNVIYPDVKAWRARV